MDTLLKDLRYAFRNLVNARGFTVVALITLALGVGSTTAMFTVINSVLLRPLPFPEPEHLVAINEYNSDRPAPPVPLAQLSYPDYEDVASRSHSFESVAAYSFGEFTITGLGPAIRLNGQLVSSNLFQLLGVQPALGRSFLADEDNPGHNVVIISNRFWRTRLNADRNVIGRALALNGINYTIVGVMPSGFQFAPRSKPFDLWTTFSHWASMGNEKDPPATKQRGNHSIFGIGRLKSGVALEQANADLASVARALAAEYPDKNRHTGIAARPELLYMIGDTRQPLLILMGAVALVLLIACANVANLLLARGAGRAREVAVRAALGATRMRIVRQLTTESVLLATAGAVVGAALATWAVPAVLKLYPANLPRSSEIAVDYRVQLFTACMAVLTGILFGLLPAWRVSAPNLSETMRQGGTSTTGRSHNRIRAALVIAETAIGVMLLIGAGLLIRSFERLSHIDLGFNADHVLTASFDFPDMNSQPGDSQLDQMDRFVRDFVARVNALPGVTAAGSMPLPLGGNDLWSVGFKPLDHPVPESEFPSASFYLVTNGFLQTMQIPLLSGRFFDDRDQRNSAPVMIITKTLAEKSFPGENPIGRKIYIGAGEGSARERYSTREIVGVVADIRTTAVTRPPAPAFYVPLSQMMWGPPTLVIRSQSNAAAITPSVTKILASMSPASPLYDVRSLEDWLALDLGRARFQTVLLGLFAGLALLMTAVGLYGVVAYTVTQRTHEIGIRMALGASRFGVLGMMLNNGLKLTLLGIATGIAGALAFSRVVGSLLYQIDRYDPVTYIAVCATLFAVALLASYFPALTATRVDPLVALRNE